MDNITSSDKMAYCGAVPWHGKGIDCGGRTLTGSEMFHASGHDRFTIEQKPLLAVIDPTTQLVTKVPHYVANVFSDNGDVAGIVGEGYSITQPSMLYSIADAVCEAGHGGYETAGSLGNRTSIWTLLKLGERTIRRRGGRFEEIGQYLLLTTGFDGKQSMIATITTVRVVCNNTLNAAIGGNGNNIKIRHSGNVQLKIDEATRILLESAQQFDMLASMYQELAEVPFSLTSFDLFAANITDVVGNVLKDDASDFEKDRRQSERSDLRALFAEGPGNTGETKWDAYNAVTDWLDHHRQAYRQSADEEKRSDLVFRSTMYGANVTHKGTALKMLAKAA